MGRQVCLVVGALVVVACGGQGPDAFGQLATQPSAVGEPEPVASPSLPTKPLLPSAEPAMGMMPAIAPAAPVMDDADADGGAMPPAADSGMPTTAAISGAFVPEKPAAGWRWESSLGVELAVPDHWKINDTDCFQTDAPSVVRAQGAVADCFRAEPKTKQIVEIISDSRIEEAPRPSGFEYQDVSIGSESAERGEGQTPDGRAAGWLHIPGVGVIVDVRVKDTQTLHKVLDSVHLVEIDHNLCATAREDMLAAAPKSRTLVPSNTNVFSVCLYDSAILGGSTVVHGRDAENLVALLNGATDGPNLDAPASQCPPKLTVPPPDVVLIAHAEDDTARVAITCSTCTHRGMTNGRMTSQVNERIVQAIITPLYSGFGYNALPD